MRLDAGTPQELPDALPSLALAHAQLAEERQRNELLIAAVGILPDLFYVKDLQLRFMVANQALARQLGATGPDAVVGKTDAEFHEPHLAVCYREEEEAVIADGTTRLVEQPARRADGTAGWFISLKAPLRNAQGEIVGIIGHGRDITDQKRTEMAVQAQTQEMLRLSEAVATAKREAERIRDLLVEAAAVLSDGFALFDQDDRLVVCNESFSSAFGGDAIELTGLSFREILCRPAFRNDMRLDDQAFEQWLRKRIAVHLKAAGIPSEWEHDGRWFLIQERRTANGSIVLSRSDITHLKRTEENLRRLATRDGLTGLSNRRDFIEQGSRVFNRLTRAPRPAALILFDIDHFKEVNDTFGHRAGDEVLRQVALLCTGLLRPTDLLARWGGEEFVQLVFDNDAETALGIAERLRDGIEAMAAMAGGRRMRVTASFGVALSDPSIPNLEALIDRADLALYCAKQAGRNCIRLADTQAAR